ncbi:hypothetical protein A6A04_11700 [Paramagnetospirillum marisnigri]|uniref:Beta-lactamase-related domain-containing protein n=1 Tax=Paramagnetospirillum marisnigri TaxID=1285242 RepID=A0A178MVM2_9PROT|nr:hypothetical protein A6A04_11700 [Paramagnetospirillum marisnigri]
MSALLIMAATMAAGPVQAADLAGTLSELAAKFRFPGAVLLVSGPGGVETAVTGHANLASRVPVTEATRFHVASVGKMLTAVAALQLVEEGRLSLDAPVRPFLDEREAARLTHVDKATVSDLLTHTSGLPDCLRNGLFSTPEHPNIRWTASEALRLGQCRPATTPGAYAYSNTNYILLGHLLELSDKAELADILARRVLTPLGMADSTAMVDPADALLARGYRPASETGGRRDASHLAWATRLGDAPLTATARDLERFMSSLFRPDRPRVLPPRMLAAMAIERASADGEGYGWGLQVVPTDRGIRLGHSGRFAGFCAEAWYYPDQDRVVILLANGDEHTQDDPMDLIEERIMTD